MVNVLAVVVENHILVLWKRCVGDLQQQWKALYVIGVAKQTNMLTSCARDTPI